jgi:hypothetical protein
MFAIGIMPNPFLNLFDQSSERILGRVRVAARPALGARRLALGPTSAPASQLAKRLVPTPAKRQAPSARRRDRREP